MKSKTPLYSGMLGGGVIIAIFLIILFSISLFNYRINIEKINVNAIKVSNKTKQAEVNLAYSAQQIFKKKMIKSLEKDKLVLTPQEYTDNIVNYYNSLLLVLSVMLAAFSILSFVYLKSQSNDLIQEKLQSDEFREKVGDALVGKAEDRFRETITELQEKISSLENTIAELEENNNDNELE